MLSAGTYNSTWCKKTYVFVLMDNLTNNNSIFRFSVTSAPIYYNIIYVPKNTNRIEE